MVSCGGFLFPLIESHLIWFDSCRKRNTRRRSFFFSLSLAGCCRRRLGRVESARGEDKWRVWCQVKGFPCWWATAFDRRFWGWKRVGRLPRARAATSVKRYKQTNKQKKRLSSFSLSLSDSLVDSRCREGGGGLCASEMCPCVYCADPKRKRTGSCPPAAANALGEEKDKEGKNSYKASSSSSHSLRCQANLINRLSIFRCISPSSSSPWVNHKLDPLLLWKGLGCCGCAWGGIDQPDYNCPERKGAGPKRFRARARDNTQSRRPVKKKEKNFCGKRRNKKMILSLTPPPLLFIMISFCLPPKKNQPKKENKRKSRVHLLAGCSPPQHQIWGEFLQVWKKKQLASSFFTQ